MLSHRQKSFAAMASLAKRHWHHAPGDENVILLRGHWELVSRLRAVLNMAAPMRTYSQPR